MTVKYGPENNKLGCCHDKERREYWKNRIIEVIESLDDMRFLSPVDENAVSAAEDALGLRFAEEYREYVILKW